MSEEIPVLSDQGGIPEIEESIPEVPPPVPEPPNTMKRLSRAELLKWKVGDPIPHGYQNRGGSLCETRKNSKVPPDYAPDVWRSFSASHKKNMIAKYQKTLSDQGNTSATVAHGCCSRDHDDDTATGSESGSDESCDDGVHQIVCAIGGHKCSIYNAAPCEECFQICCGKHTDEEYAGRKCVNCTGLLALAAKVSIVEKDDGDVTDPEDRERESDFRKVGPSPKLPTERRRRKAHREKVMKHDIPFSALVARPVKRDEIKRTPAAQAALQKEWSKLRKAGCWDEKNVREWDDVMREARSKGKKAHNARLFEICVEKGSELPAGDPNRKFKGRVVLQGNHVKDEYYDHAIFAELSSCPSTMEAAKSGDAFGLLPGHVTEQCDAEQAYTQAKIQGTETWIEIPQHEWPESWKGMKRPVCLLILALYGHPDAGGYWEKHCERHLLSVGFTQIEEWRSCYYHKKLKLFLTVYVDDFKMSGPRENVKAGWKLIRQGVKTEEPTPAGKYLGCDHIEGVMDVTDFKNPLHPDLSQRKKENAATVPPYQGDGTKKRVRALKYDMKDFLAQCVDRYVELTKVDRKKIVKVDTPFIDLPKDDPTVESPKTGALQSIASKVLMKILYAARMGRFDLLKATCALASRVTKWTESCDKLLHRLICYVHSTLDVFLHGWIGDKMEDLRLELYTDSDFAGDLETMRSTSGVFLVLVGRNSFFPLHATSKRQSCVSHSTTEAEIVAADLGHRVTGLPALCLWDTLFQRKVECHSMEDNSAMIRILETGKNPQLRYMGRTHKVNVAWLAEVIKEKSFLLKYVISELQCGDIFTKVFLSADKWRQVRGLIGHVLSSNIGFRPKIEATKAMAAEDTSQQKLLILVHFTLSKDSVLCNKIFSDGGLYKTYSLKFTKDSLDTLRSSAGTRTRLSGSLFPIRGVGRAHDMLN